MWKYVAEGDCYNRAYYTTIHFNSASPMVSDAHFITPTDGKVNAIRSQLHSVVVTPTETTRNGSNWELVLRQVILEPSMNLKVI
jgi:hypothetical protein